LAECKEPMIRLGENCQILRAVVERGRPDSHTHPDIDKLNRDVSDVLNRWQHLTEDANTK